MKYLFNSIFFYFLFPSYLALGLLFYFFHIPAEYYYGLVAFILIITIPVIVSTTWFPLKINIQEQFNLIRVNHYGSLVIFSLCLLIILCGPLDIYLNGFKLLNPRSYFTLSGLGRYVRHITILCWLFIPIAFTMTKNPAAKLFLVGYALIFPVLIMDRNRLFLSCYAFFLCLISSSKAQQVKRWNKLLIISLPLALFCIFPLLGLFRSGGDAFEVASSGAHLEYGYYPLKTAFAKLPILMQQIILYITTPIFNFATVVSAKFFNHYLLISQFAPFSREHYAPLLFVPVLVTRFNVGTEFYPFLLYGGLPMVTAAYLGLLLFFISVCCLFKKYPNIFTFIIFIKMSYCVLFMGFAPQFFILLNFIFFILVIMLWCLTEFLPKIGHAVAQSKFRYRFD